MSTPDRVERIFDRLVSENHGRTSRVFAALNVAQWVFGIALAMWWSPYSWAGSEKVVHANVYAAVFLGGAIASLPIALALTRPSAGVTRFVVGVAQMLWSALLIHLSGGRIETHFHVFGSLAFLAFYRDWRILVVATVVVAGDHLLRGILWPRSVYGIGNPEWWRFLEHAGWVVFEDVVLVLGCLRGVREMRLVAVRQAEVEALSEAREVAAREERSRLEELVGARTRELAAKNRDLSRVLHHVADGVGTADRDGRLGPERSRALELWFGPPEPGETIWAYLGRADAAFGEKLEAGWVLLQDDAFPMELAIDQLPKTLKTPTDSYSFRVTPLENHAGGGFLVVVERTTADVAQREIDAARRDLAVALEQVLRDREGFADFVRETTRLVEVIARPGTPRVELARALHTLKGNAALMSFEGIAGLCHSMESYMAETGEPPTSEALTSLRDRWNRMAMTFDSLSGVGDDRVRIDRSEYDELVEEMRRGASGQEMAARAKALAHEPAERVVARLADKTRALAKQLGRGSVFVEMQSSDVRLDPAKWGPFWAAFVHVLRNAMRHGIEPADERAACGKPDAGKISLALLVHGGELVVEAADDGRGIDWDRVEAAAKRRGLPHGSRAALEASLFADGMTTVDSADMASGRGVGLPAVLAETRRLGGRIEIQSHPGRGTRFRFRFRLPEVAAALEHGLRCAAN